MTESLLANRYKIINRIGEGGMRIVSRVYDTTAYGDIQPCCYIPISFGNVRKEPLKVIVDRIWRSSYFKQGKLHCLDCPTNDDKFRSKILKLMEGRQEYPVEFNESAFRTE